MAIAPITGTLKRKIIVDITVGFSIGLAFGTVWWTQFHKPRVARREQYYAELAKKKQLEDEA